MSKISRITVISESNLGKQVLKDHLTPTEKKILVYMLNAGMDEGVVKNKAFKIVKTEKDIADVTIKTTVMSEVLRRKETTAQRVKIKYS